MAKITIVGDAVVVTSAMKLEDIRTIEKYRPDALTLMGGEDNKEPVFAIGTTTCGTGNINSVGASFAGETHDDQRLATITLCGACATGDIKDWVADSIGRAIISLNKLEAGLTSVLSAIVAEKAKVLENITVV